MSFILEALRKAERERNLGQVPAWRVGATPVYAGRRGFSPWWIAALAILVGGGIGAAGWWRQQATEEPTVITADSAQPVPAPAAPPATAAAPEPAPPAAPPTERVEVQTAQGPVELEMPATPPAPTPAPQPLPVPKLSEPEAPSAPMQEMPAADEPDDAELPAREMPPEEVPIEPIGPDTPELPPEQAMVEDLPSYHGLPENLRSAIPQLNMTAHVYSSTPGRGFAMINGKKYRQGDKLAEGPEVVQILPDSVVLSYRGTDFLLPVPR